MRLPPPPLLPGGESLPRAAAAAASSWTTSSSLLLPRRSTFTLHQFPLPQQRVVESRTTKTTARRRRKSRTTTTTPATAASPTSSTGSTTRGGVVVVEDDGNRRGDAAASRSRLAKMVVEAKDLPVGLDPFCFRQFDDPEYSGTRLKYDKTAFVDEVNEFLRKSPDARMVEGYAPFCRHVFIPNFVDAEVAVLPINAENRHLLRSGYLQRRPEELAVLSRWFPLQRVASRLHKATYLDLILYSREQIAKETAAMGRTTERDGAQSGDDAAVEGHSPPWSIIAVKAQDESFEQPMSPITMMRNTLISEGGSGVSLDRSAYAKAVEYWKQHAVVGQDNDDDDGGRENGEKE